MNKRTFKIVLAIVVVLVALTGCKSGGGGGGSDDSNNTPPREFEIKDHELLVGDKECYSHHYDLGYTVPEIVNVCGVIAIRSDEAVLDYEHVYGIRYYTMNDHRNTRHINIEIFDINDILTLAHDGPIINPEDEQVEDVLYPLYVVWLEDDGNTSPMYTVEAWLTDVNGVTTPVYTFDVETVEAY